MVPDDLVCFFLSSTCMTVIWNSTIIRTAGKRGLGSCLLELPCQYFHPPSLVSCPLELSLLSVSLFHDALFYSFYRFFSNIFSSPFFFEVSFITSILYCLIFLRSTSTHTHRHTHKFPYKLCVQVLFDGAVSVFDSHFRIPQCYHMPGEATLFLSASHFDPRHTKMKQKQGSQTDHWML